MIWKEKGGWQTYNVRMYEYEWCGLKKKKMFFGDEEEKDILGIFNLLRLVEEKIEKICLWKE